MLWLPPAAPSRFGLVLAEPGTASGRTPQPKALRGQAGPYEHLIATGDHRRSDRQAQCFSWCSQGSSRCSCSPARGRDAVGCGVRPEAMLGSASTMPNRDVIAGGSQSKCHVFGAKHRAQRRIFSAHEARDVAHVLGCHRRLHPRLASLPPTQAPPQAGPRSSRPLDLVLGCTSIGSTLGSTN